MKKQSRISGIVAVVASLVVLALAIPAGASAWTGNASWTYKTTWNTYVNFNWTGPGTPGVHDITASNGATETSDGVFNHGIDSGATTYNRLANSGTVAYDGAVRSLNEAHYIDIELIDPRIEIAAGGNSANLTAQAIHRPLVTDPLGWGAVTDEGRIVFATISNLNSVRTTSGTTTTWTGAVPELTAAGADLFEGGYPVGTGFGAITFSATP